MDSVCSYPLHLFYTENKDILLETSDNNLFDRTVGFSNYSMEECTEIKGLIDYAFSIIRAAQAYIDKTEIQLINSSNEHNFADHTISAIIKHLDLFDMAPTITQSADVLTLYKIKIIQWANKYCDKLLAVESLVQSV